LNSASSSPLRVVILCGGKGTRIRGVNDDVPKPMIPVGHQPMLVHIMEHYAHFGHEHFVLCLGYLGSVIRRHFGADVSHGHEHIDYVLPSGRAVHIVLADTGEDSMTGGRLWAIRDIVGNEDFCLTYGDGISTVPIREVIDFHSSHRAAMTLTAVHPPGRFGEVEVDEAGFATSFNEKPQVSAGLISGGYFVCRSSVFDYLSGEENSVLEAEPMRLMVRDKQLRAYVHHGFWQCMDTFRDWELLNEIVRKQGSLWLR